MATATRHPGRWAAALAGGAILAGSLALVALRWRQVAAAGGPFLAHRLTWMALGIWSGGALVLAVLVVALRQLSGRRRAGGQAGTASVEMALLLPVALTVVLAMVQSMLLAAGNLAVHYAAYNAARTAVVRIPEKVSYDEPRNVVSDPDSSEKVRRVRHAAALSLLAVSAGGDVVSGDPSSPAFDAVPAGLARFYAANGQSAPNWLTRTLPARYAYAWAFTNISLSPPASGAVYGDHEDVTVDVTHSLYLQVPYMNRVLALLGSARRVGGSGHYATDVRVSYTLPNEGVEDEIDVEQFPVYVGRGG